MRKNLLFIVFFMVFTLLAKADGGMWIPLFLSQNEAEMQQLGFRLTADDIYSINHSSMKDAIVLFGGGCTAELISPKGLLLTNHHCGYSYVQSHSTMENNYLKDGFWAKSMDQEIPMEGLTVTFLVYMSDVTDQVLKGVDNQMKESERQLKIEENMRNTINDAIKGTDYKAIVKPFYYGNQYFIFVTETYEDIRLVGVPPESIGKFGGDSDNWMWPRHTGDFSLYRIYTDKNGKPAKYSSENVPMQPKKFFPISIKGVNENDFTLVFGYPGTTRQFLISDGVNAVANIQNPIAIQARTIRLDAMKRQMNLDPRIRLMYSAKANGISNGWKKWQGESKGIRECNVIAKKQAQELEFQRWVNADNNRKAHYGSLLQDMKNVYDKYGKHLQDVTFINECFFGVELVEEVVYPYMSQLFDVDVVSESARKKIVSNDIIFRAEYFEPIDRECFVELMTYYFTAEPAENIPSSLRKYVQDEKTVRKMMTELWDNNASKAPYFGNGEKYRDFVAKASKKQIAKTANNELVALYQAIFSHYRTAVTQYRAENRDIDNYYRTYVKALMEKDADKTFYPDANLTMRVTYGQVKGFKPADGVKYEYYTTLDGIMEKEDPDVYDYQVHPRLKELWQKKDYGRYADKNGQLPVAFIASNHTTGGNSGSPVINGDGYLVGTNFDRVWEGTMSDIYYDVDRCRNISLDARYFLFIVDKFAGATNIIDEMTVIE